MDHYYYMLGCGDLMKKYFIIMIIVFLISVAPMSAKALEINGVSSSQNVYSLDKLPIISTEIKTVKTAKIDTKGLKNELQIYRYLYGLHAVMQGFVHMTFVR